MFGQFQTQLRGSSSKEPSFKRKDAWVYKKITQKEAPASEELAKAASLVQKLWRNRKTRKLLALFPSVTELKAQYMDQEALEAGAQDNAMYSEAALKARELLFHAPEVVSALRAAWHSLAGGVPMGRDAYCLMMRKLYLAINGAAGAELDCEDCKKNVEKDWASDSGERPLLDEEPFKRCWFQMADLHTPGLDAAEYATWLTETLDAISVIMKEPESKKSERPAAQLSRHPPKRRLKTDAELLTDLHADGKLKISRNALDKLLSKWQQAFEAPVVGGAKSAGVRRTTSKAAPLSPERRASVITLAAASAVDGPEDACDDDLGGDRLGGGDGAGAGVRPPSASQAMAFAAQILGDDGASVDRTTPTHSGRAQRAQPMASSTPGGGVAARPGAAGAAEPGVRGGGGSARGEAGRSSSSQGSGRQESSLPGRQRQRQAAAGKAAAAHHHHLPSISDASGRRVGDAPPSAKRGGDGPSSAKRGSDVPSLATGDGKGGFMAVCGVDCSRLPSKDKGPDGVFSPARSPAGQLMEWERRFDGGVMRWKRLGRRTPREASMVPSEHTDTPSGTAPRSSSGHTPLPPPATPVNTGSQSARGSTPRRLVLAMASAGEAGKGPISARGVGGTVPGPAALHKAAAPGGHNSASPKDATFPAQRVRTPPLAHHPAGVGYMDAKGTFHYRRRHEYFGDTLFAGAS